MKKVFAITVVIVMIFTLLTGCSYSDNATKRVASPATDFEYRVYDNNVVGIEKYIGENTKVVIPEEIEGWPVVAVMPTAFMNTDVELIDIPDTVIAIWSNAFTNCQKLHTVKMGDGVTSIGYEAFKKCTKLKNLTLPSSLTEIDSRAFENCESLENLFIPKSVTDWGMEAFFNCPLTTLAFENGIKNIGGYACFWGATITEITIPSSVEKIGEYSFHDNLQKVVFLGDAPEKLGKQPFGTKATIYHQSEAAGWDTTVLKEEYKIVAQ